METPPVVEVVSTYSTVSTFKKISTSKKVRILLIGVSILVIALVTYSAFAYYNQTHKPIDSGAQVIKNVNQADSLSATPTPVPGTKIAAFLDGELVETGKENFQPLAVMIENHPDARPQSGLSSASVVYEAIAEGGITRFMAIFKDPSQAVKIGPVRSARTYFVDLASEYHAFYAHVGGNSHALDQLKTSNAVYNMDQFSIGEQAFHREPNRNVALEHTMYSSTEKLWTYATETKKWPRQGNYQSLLFQDDLELAKRPAKQEISVFISDALYNSVWKYDPQTNLYTRSMAGKPHIDANTGAAITTKNIILETVQKTPLPYKDTNVWQYTLTGSGSATVIQNGTSIPATWKRSGNERTRYYDSNNQEIKLVRGKTWVHIVHPETKVTFTTT